MVQAETGAPQTPKSDISNPLDPAVWSDTIADEVDIDFAWLDSPDYWDEFQRARERLNEVMRHHFKLPKTSRAKSYYRQRV